MRAVLFTARAHICCCIACIFCMSSGDILDIMSCAIFIISGFIMAGFIAFGVGAWAATAWTCEEAWPRGSRSRSLPWATRLVDRKKSRNENKQQVRVW